MPKFEVTAPDGKRYDVNAPDGATEQDAIAYVQREFYGAAKTPDSRINGFEFAGLVCDPLAFDMTDKVPPGAQGEMVLADRARSSFEGSFFLIAAILLSLVGILPASWYFLLRRLREVAAAIRGE